MKNKIIRRLLTNHNPVLDFVAKNISSLDGWIEILIEDFEMQYEREASKRERDADIERMLKVCYPKDYAQLADLHDLLIEAVGAIYDLTRYVQRKDIETGFAWVEDIGMCHTRNGEPIEA